jgi:hypothetical protein
MCEFTASGKPGVPAAPPVDGWIGARKREHQVTVRFAATTETVQTREGPVDAAPGDAIITGAAGEAWPVAQAVFAQRYRHIAGATYMAIPLGVRACRQVAPFTALLADGRTRLHGVAGDWLIDYGDGSLGIVGAAIFPLTYELSS